MNDQPAGLSMFKTTSMLIFSEEEFNALLTPLLKIKGYCLTKSGKIEKIPGYGLNASAKIKQRKSKKTKPIKRVP